MILILADKFTLRCGQSQGKLRLVPQRPRDSALTLFLATRTEERQDKNAVYLFVPN